MQPMSLPSRESPEHRKISDRVTKRLLMHINIAKARLKRQDEAKKNPQEIRLYEAVDAEGHDRLIGG